MFNRMQAFIVRSVPATSALSYIRFSRGKRYRKHWITTSAFQKNIGKILYLLPLDLEETILEIPALAELARRFPGSGSSVFCTRAFADLFRNSPGLPPAIAYEPEETRPFGPKAGSWIHFLREQKFDACFFLGSSPDLDRSFLCAEAEIPIRMAVETPVSKLFCNFLLKPSSAAQDPVPGALLRCLGLSFQPKAFYWNSDEKARETARHLLFEWGIFPGERITAVAREIDEPVRESLVERLVSEGGKVLLTCDGQVEPVPGKSQPDKPGVFSVPALSFSETVSLLSHCCAWVGNPGPSLLLASYARIPVLSFFDSIKSEIYGRPVFFVPRSRNREQAVQGALDAWRINALKL